MNHVAVEDLPSPDPITRLWTDIDVNECIDFLPFENGVKARDDGNASTLGTLLYDATRTTTCKIDVNQSSIDKNTV